MRPSLPIDPLIPGLLESLGRTPNLVLEAPPGAGKTTRIPPALSARGAGKVLVLEPRRLAARLAARRVAAEMGEQIGETVGYQVRFEEVSGPRTRLLFVTEGILTRRLAADPKLAGVDAVVLDEFHERRLDGDLALALLRRLQRTRRPELRLLVMSATLDTAPVAAFLGGCPVLRSEGRQHPVDIRYTPVSPLAQAEQVRRALESLLREGLDGDLLVFLPGAAEIREAARACAETAQRAGLLLLPLHGDLTPEEQDRAVAPAARRKVILSTNVAESSVTIEGVTAVIDTGLARVASASPWTGLPVLKVARISKASANQRAGRAGRTGPGRVIRLYPAEDFHRRPDHDPPEITRKELSEVMLAALAMGVPAGGIEWLDRPPEASVEAAVGLLRALGAVDAGGRLTPLGRKMAAYPVHPRLSRLVIEADRRGAGETGCVIAALLSAGARIPQRRATSGPSDLLAMAEAPLDPAVRRIRDQIRRVRRLEPARGTDDEAVLQAVLTAFPDRVARRRAGDDLLLAGGGAARLARDSVVRGEEWMVAVDIEERSERGLPLVRLASAIRPEWLLDLFPEYVQERRAVEWNRKAERVESSSALTFGALALAESRDAAPDPEAAAELLAARAAEAGWWRFAGREEVEEFLARVEFAAAHSPVRALDETDVREALAALCAGRRSFAELREAASGGGLVRALELRLGPGGAASLRAAAPERVRLAGGRQVRVRYARGQPPWIASRLQDFFGMRDTPRVARGAVPLTVHLLAPNQRPVQTTTDLAGFWERLYPQVRRELGRRYPRHAWPQDPLTPAG